MSCTIEIRNANIEQAFKKRFGTNENTIFTYWSAVVKNGEFTKEFQEWQQKQRKTDTLVTIEIANPKTIVTDIINYYNRNFPDGNLSVLDINNATSGNYNSIADRMFCQHTVANEILDIFRNHHYGKFNESSLSKNDYIDKVRTSFYNRVLDRVCSVLNITEDEFQSHLNEERFYGIFEAYLNNGETEENAQSLAIYQESLNIAKDLLGNNANNQDINLLATFEEMINSTKDITGTKISDKFFNEVFRDSRVSELRRNNKDEFGTLEEDIAQDSENVELGEETDETDNSHNDQFDMSFRVFDSHSGQYSTFTTHIGGNIKSYLGSLRKLNGTGKIGNSYNYNTNNPIGIADTMSANECAVMLYTRGNYTNVSTMIDSIEQIANTIPGYEAFIQFANDLRSNYDFAYEVYRTFGKMVIGRKETYIQNGERKTRISNTAANKLDALRFEYLNSIRTSAIDIDHVSATDQCTKLIKTINDFKTSVNRGVIYDVESKRNIPFKKDSIEYRTKKAEIINAITIQFKQYLPTIDSGIITNYIITNKKDGIVNEIDNAIQLATILSKIIISANKSKTNYIGKIAQANNLRKENKDTTSIWETDYIDTSCTNELMKLADMLIPYSIPKVELNNRNAAGNLSSSVINSSMITNFMNILTSDLNATDNPNSPLNNYGNYKFRSNQYNLSNILVEKIKDGTTINKGLFRLIDGKYVPTEYARTLLSLSLFDGISDFGNNKSAVYSQMSKSDYVITAMVNFFNSTKSADGIILSDYMMRIPSDAPKNFILTAPRYSLTHVENGKTINLFELENPHGVNDRINELIGAIPHGNLEQYDEVVSLENQINGIDKNSLSTNQIIKLLAGYPIASVNIRNTKALHKEKNSSTGYLNLEIDGTTLILKGTIENNSLSNATLYGVVNNYGNNAIFSSEINTALKDFYRNKIIKGDIKLSDGSVAKRKINTNHPIFQQLYSAFEQEMINAATAIDKLFVHGNGQILLHEQDGEYTWTTKETDKNGKVKEIIHKKKYKRGEPVLSTYFAQMSNHDRASYANYHRKSNKYIDERGITHTENGIVQNLWIKRTREDGTVYYEKTNQKRLSGNVFTSDRFTLFDETTGTTRNYLQEVISEEQATSEDGLIHIFYGGANTHLHINSNGTIEFTDAQKATIENKLKEFIEDYVAATIEKTNKYNKFLNDTPHTNDDVAEFILNYRLAYINCNDLFEGDTKFYKNAQDFLKRGKEVQGSGVPYGIVDFSKPMFGERTEIPNSYLNNKEMQELVGSLHDCKQYNRFRAVTVTNTVRPIAEASAILTEQLVKRFTEEGLTERDVKNKAKAILDNYNNIKTNDAQSYITFEEWIRRISARGQLHKYKPLIEAILDESKPLDSSVIQEFVQVQKNFYYDMTYNEATGVMSPRQIKNAEFVLVPRLIRGTELETVYNAMIHYGIDQLNTEETSKAGKANVLTLWDNDGNLTKEWLQDFNQNITGAIEYFDYNNLYTQQETPQHINAENKAGIQIVKKIIDNISEDSKLYPIKQRFLDNFSENITDSFQNLMAELNVKLDKDGNLELDENGLIQGISYDKILKKWEDEMIRLGLDSNMLDYITLKDDVNGNQLINDKTGLPTKMSPYLSSSKRKLENISQAIFNNYITRQKLPGFHAAQITQIGWKSFGQQVTKRYYSNKLRFHPNGEKYIEIMLPASNFGISRSDKQFDWVREKAQKENWSIDKLEQELDHAMLAKLQQEKLDVLIGYRIPSESKHSACVMKVVGFTSDGYGSTIVVPDEWVAQTGSDFDIDSIYGIQYSTKMTANGIEKIQYSEDTKQNWINYVMSNIDKNTRNEIYQKAKAILPKYKEILEHYATLESEENGLMSFEEYSKQSFAKQNSREARNNQILDDMITILQSDESLEENLSPSGFQHLIDARNKVMSNIDKARRNSRSPYDFFDQSDYQEDAMSGAKLKAFSVTRDTFCSICNTVKPYLSNSIDIIYNGDKNKFKELQERFNETNGDKDNPNVVYLGNEKILVKHTMFGHSNDNKNIVGEVLTGYTSETTAHQLDAIKEGNVQNVNDYTFAVYKLFPDIGSDFETAISFMMQPGISAIVNAYNNSKSIYSNKYSNIINDAINAIASELGISPSNNIKKTRQQIEILVEQAFPNGINVLNSETLINRINELNEFSSPVAKYAFDYLIIKEYEKLSNIADKIGTITRVTNSDKFGAKQTMFATNKVFDDITDILEDSKQVFRTNILEEIYPGISEVDIKGIDSFLAKDRRDESKYPTLYTFLRTSTAASIKINSMLFKTQQPKFKRLVNGLINVMSGTNPRLTEETYNKFENYILNAIYNKVNLIARPITYDYKRGIISVDGNIESEKARIFGYGYQPEIKVKDENGNFIEFNPKNINKPTQKELAQFATLTPAQKVYWIQKNFRDGLITKYIKTNLVNLNQYRQNKAGSQTIEFIEDGTDSETLYTTFYNTFANKNPLLVMTAMDIIKYSFVVEGFQMRRSAVNKLIDNDVLANPQGFTGTGIMEEIDEFINNIDTTFDTIDIKEIRNNYVRSHSDMKEISHTYIAQKEAKEHMRISNKGIITIFDNNYNTEFLLKHNVVNQDGRANKYITISGQKANVLYKIIPSQNSNVIYLIPLNKLQETENSIWSANLENDIYQPQEYYETIIDKYEENHETWDGDSFYKYSVEQANDLQKVLDNVPDKPKRQSTIQNVEPIDFDINDTSIGAIVQLKERIKQHFDGTRSDMLILQNGMLEDHIKGFGITNGLRKIIDGNPYWIYRLQTTSNTTSIGNEGTNLMNYTSKKGLHTDVLPKDKPFEILIQEARARGIASGHPGEAHIWYAYAVIPANSSNNDIMHSSITESVERKLTRIDRDIHRQAINGDNNIAENYVNQISQRNNNTNLNSTNNNLDNVIISTTEYVTNKVESILNGENSLNLFTQDPDTGSYIPITDQKVIALIKKNPALRRKYIRTLLEANHLISTFESFSTFKYNDDNNHLKYYVDKINKAIQSLQNSTVLEEAEQNYITGYLASISNNPNVKNDIISLLDSFHSTSWMSAYLNDLQETANPIIQIITSDVMSDIRAKELQGKERIREFNKFMKTIKETAAKNGHTINWDNIVDEYGKFINDYNQKFVDDLENLRNNKDEAYQAYLNAESDYDKAIMFENYLQKRLAYNKWKLKHINQELVDDYYKKVIENEERMLNENGKFTDIYVEYCRLNDKLRNIYSHDTNGLDSHWEQEKEKIQIAIRNLKSDAVLTPFGTFEYKKDLEDYELSADPIIRRNQNINSATSANRLRKFIETRNEINDTYYKRTERFGFKEQLKRYLSTINKYESTNLTEDDLAQIPEYVTAKNWVKQNAVYNYKYLKPSSTFKLEDQHKLLLDLYDKGFDYFFNENSNEDEISVLVNAALNILKSTIGEKHNPKAAYKLLAKARDARDENGVIDGRKFSDEDIKIVKKEQEARYGIGESSQFSEKSIIKNSSSDDTIYSDAFYKGMNVNGIPNQEYIAIVKEINKILRPYISSTGVLNTASLSREEIKRVLEQFEKIGYKTEEQEFRIDDDTVRKYKGVSRENVKQVKEFIDKYVEFTLTETDKNRFEFEKQKAKERDATEKGYFLDWLTMNTEWNDTEKQFVPNHLLWGHAQPKSTLSEEERNKFINKEKTAAIRIINGVFTAKPSKYYELVRTELAEKYGINSNEYKQWYEANHIYNPHTHKVEPIICWMKSEPNENMPGEWEPAYSMTDRSVNEEYKNASHRANLGIEANYKKGSNAIYDNETVANAEELKLKEYVQSLLSTLATTKKAKKYINSGNLPTRALHEHPNAGKIWLNELAKGFGFVSTTQGSTRWNEDVSYDTDYVPDMPMLSQLTNKETINAPYREQYNTEEEYIKAKEEWNKNKLKNTQHNREIHKALIDRNWESVIEEFIEKATHYNAIQDNKYALYFGQKLINDIPNYNTRNSNSNKLSKDNSVSTNDITVYRQSVDSKLQDQYTNWIRRVIFDQYKKNEGAKTRFATILQSITSTSYMTLNVRGGIANILVGESNILGEAFAKEYFDSTDWARGKQLWLSAFNSFASNLYSETSTSVGDAIVKFMAIVDYDTVTGRNDNKDLLEYSKRLRDAMYSPQSMGEHFMQNAAMFSMMTSHKLVPNPKAGQPGEPKNILMNLSEYLANSQEIALKEVIGDNQELLDKYREFINKIKSDANVAKDYAWFKNNPVTTFVTTRLTNSQQQAYLKAEKKYKQQAKEDFAKYETLYSQFKVGDDGKLDFADNSELSKMNVLKDGQEITDAYRLLGKFKQKVISVNKKIHGNYGKLDAAQIENNWWGGLIMQYHKHLVPGIMKRWRVKGYFNEERGTIEKGSYVALYDFLTLPIKQIAERNRLSSGETEALIGVQNIFSVITDYIQYAKLNFNTMSDYERANMRRILGDFAGIATSIMIGVLCRLSWDDDDESIIYNLGLYEADRLAAESFMWTPIGAVSEAKTLWSSPIAAQSLPQDILNIMGTVSGIIMEGEDYDPYFHSGRYAGRHKIGVYVERRIPYWRNYVAIRDIADNNQYYKIGNTTFGSKFSKSIADTIKE